MVAREAEDTVISALPRTFSGLIIEFFAVEPAAVTLGGNNFTELKEICFHFEGD